MIYDDPLGEMRGLPPLPPKHLQHQWYDQYAGAMLAFIEQELAVNLPPEQYQKLYTDAVEAAHFYLVQQVAMTLTGITITAVTKRKIQES